MTGDVQFGEGVWSHTGELSRPIDRATAARRLKAGKKIGIRFPATDGVQAYAYHDPSLDYLAVGLVGWPEDPRNSASLRYSGTETGTLRLAEITIHSKVPDPTYGDRAFWSQFVHLHPPEHRRAMLDVPAVGRRYILSIKAAGKLDPIADLRFAMPDLDGYPSLVRPDLVESAMHDLNGFDPALPDVREVLMDEAPTGWKRSRMKAPPPG
jgi:hypothetical protein